MSDRERLAGLIQQRNDIDTEIASTIGRPERAGHIGECVAATIFDIELNAGANTRTIDGYFRDRPLAGKSVNITYGTRRDGMLNLVHSTNLADHPDYHIFENRPLVEALAAIDRTPGIATSVRRALWHAATIYPDHNNPALEVTTAQREALALFRGETPSA